jgi:5-methylcytosine-specific restriction endonuclease McrA
VVGLSPGAKFGPAKIYCSNKCRCHAFYLSNKSKIIEEKRTYYYTNQKWILAKKAIHYEENAEQERERGKRWRRNNLDKDRKRAAKYKREHPEIIRVITINYQARRRGAEGRYTRKEWEELKAKYDYRCVKCGRHESELGERLTVDHIQPLSKGGSNYITNIQPLCRSCNSTKRDKELLT